MLPIEVIFYLFDRTIVPILTDGGEVWEHEMASKLQLVLQACFKALSAHTYTDGMCGEVGKYPIEVPVQCR